LQVSLMVAASCVRLSLGKDEHADDFDEGVEKTRLRRIFPRFCSVK